MALDELELIKGENLGATGGATPGMNETELWVRNSPFTSIRIAAWSFTFHEWTHHYKWYGCCTTDTGRWLKSGKTRKYVPKINKNRGHPLELRSDI